jgi:hypothetical protein
MIALSLGDWVMFFRGTEEGDMIHGTGWRGRSRAARRWLVFALALAVTGYWAGVNVVGGLVAQAHASSWPIGPWRMP